MRSNGSTLQNVIFLNALRFMYAKAECRMPNAAPPTVTGNRPVFVYYF